MRDVPPELILCLTVQHTGTWTVLSYLHDHDGIDGFRLVGNHGNRPKTVLLGDMEIAERPGRHLLAHKHIDYLTPKWAALIGRSFPVVTTARDPLAALVTRHGRHPEKWPHLSHLETWRAWADIAGFAHVLRLEKPDWTALSLSCGLRPLPSPAAQNESRETGLHAAYRAGDGATLAKELGRAWTYLQSLEPVLRPRLERAGYRNLLWWK